MFRFAVLVIAATVATVPSAFAVTEAPENVATIVIHGFDPDGASSTGTFGEDTTKDYIENIAGTLGLPMSTTAPLVANQIAYATYYGDTPPDYYTPQDIADLNAVTTEFGGGVPRYALIIAKYAKHVMQRSGATQVNLVAVSYGGLVSRYLIEKDVEGLAGDGKIARWIAIEGVIAGNFAATYGGFLAEIFFSSYYGGDPIDFEHMNYEWVTDNLNNPRGSTDSAFFGQIPTHFWLASDDNFNNKYLTDLSGKANDGVVLMEDGVLRNLPNHAKYLGLNPTESVTHTNHESTKDHMGIRAGITAQLFGRTRVTITLKNVMVKNEFDGGSRGQGEYVFGLKVISPEAETAMGITQPIHEYRASDSSFPFIRLTPNVPVIVNQVWFDDMILPGETELILQTNVDEVDGDLIYNINEDQDGTYTSLQDMIQGVSTQANGPYRLETNDWVANIQVTRTLYPDWGEEPSGPTAAQDWTLYE